MNNETKAQSTIHLIADESLGGLNREYIETDRKAVVGDLIITFNGLIRKVEGDCGHYVDLCCGGCSLRGNHKTLAPTNVVHYEGTRYRLTDRTAKVGEKVVITERKYDTFGRVFTVSEIDEDADLAFKESDDYYAEHGTYSVLVPVEESPKLDELLSQVTPENRHAEAFVDETEASPSVLTMLANLAQRIVKLEKQTEDSALRIVDLEQDKAGLLDEIDTLHSNQKRMGEEVEADRYAIGEIYGKLGHIEADVEAVDNYDKDEVIVELTKMLVDVYRKGSRA